MKLSRPDLVCPYRKTDALERLIGVGIIALYLSVIIGVGVVMIYG